MEKLINSNLGSKIAGKIPIASTFITMSKTFNILQYVLLVVAIVFFIVFIATLIQSKQDKKNKNNNGTWIAFLVLSVVFSGGAYYCHTRSTLSGSLKMYKGGATFKKDFLPGQT